MVPDDSQSQDVDLDRTDKLPMLEGASLDADVADDAVRLDYSPVAKSVKSEYRRSSSVDLPSLAESVRSVEERIARRNAEYEALTRSHEKARAAEAKAASRAASLASDLAGVRALLESEQARSRELGMALAAQTAAAASAQARTGEALREAERSVSESRTLRDTVAARDATIVQVQHSLAERDAQLSALQREHAQIVPSLEERSTAAVQLEADLRTARARFESLTAELGSAREAVATLTAQVKRGDEELQATRHDLNDVRAQAAAHLERLRTREFRRGLDELAAVQVDHGALLSERDELRRRAADLGARLATREEAIARLQAAAAEGQAIRAKSDLKVQELERRCAGLTEKVSAGSGEAQRGKDMLSTAEQSRADLALEVLRLRAEAQEREGQMEVLLVHLQEARRSLGWGDAEGKRPTGEPAAGAPAARSRALEQLTEENRSLRTALDRTRGALEEREFLLRRLERGESNNANAAGRTQASAGAGAGAGGAVPTLECTVDLVRIDGGHNEAHALSRRTRIGRAPGCELHIDSSSVSRHHALVLANSRDIIIEDLHSTNGVLVNGRKVTRQLLTDGDILTIGEAQFRLSMKSGPREPEATEPAAR
ncbi:MAG: ral secretion pathway protein [Gammaproteobacteria bacterium]|jgi:chromosome segregation ATPase|nr:ral secretion pathway protein [Gammaproteobacteria bacterium]